MTRLAGCTTGLPLSVPAQMQPPPIVTLSLPCLPMHQHHQLQAQLQAQARLGPMSPAPAQTPPLHTVPDLSHSPLTQQPSKPPDDFYSVQSDTNTEVDALDPSIMDFAFQGKKNIKPFPKKTNVGLSVHSCLVLVRVALRLVLIFRSLWVRGGVEYIT